MAKGLLTSGVNLLQPAPSRFPSPYTPSLAQIIQSVGRMVSLGEQPVGHSNIALNGQRLPLPHPRCRHLSRTDLCNKKGDGQKRPWPSILLVVTTLDLHSHSHFHIHLLQPAYPSPIPASGTRKTYSVPSQSQAPTTLYQPRPPLPRPRTATQSSSPYPPSGKLVPRPPAPRSPRHAGIPRRPGAPARIGGTLISEHERGPGHSVRW